MGGGSHPVPDITGGPGLQKIYFGPQFGRKLLKGGQAHPLDLQLSSSSFNSYPHSMYFVLEKGKKNRQG